MEREETSGGSRLRNRFRSLMCVNHEEPDVHRGARERSDRIPLREYSKRVCLRGLYLKREVALISFSVGSLFLVGLLCTVSHHLEGQDKLSLLPR